MNKYLFIFVFLVCNASVFAQTKVGHVNTGLVLESMPEAAVADSLMRLYQDTLTTQLQNLQLNFQQKYKNLGDSIQLITPNQRQQKEVELQQLQQEIQTFQAQSQQMFEARRGQYLTPLVKKVQTAIDTYAKKNGYNAILDASIPGALLYVNDENDLTKKIIEMIK